MLVRLGEEETSSSFQATETKMVSSKRYSLIFSNLKSYFVSGLEQTTTADLERKKKHASQNKQNISDRLQFGGF